MSRTRFFTWFRVAPLAVVFVFGLISLVYSYAPAAFFKPLYPIDYEAYVKQSSISHNLDPYLVCAVIKSESNWDPEAESNQGAQGLMQVIPRFHQDKVPDGAGEKALLDPVINIKVGTHVLEEAIRRRGGLIPGLQHYAGSSDPTGAYANKVLAEKHRLEQAARRASAAATRAAANSAPATPQA